VYTFDEELMQTLKNSVKDQILHAAIQEFKDKGYVQASLRHIAQEANISVGNVYRYFDSKEELFKSIIYPPLKRFETILSLEPSSFSHPKVAFNELAELFSTTLISLIQEDKDALYVALNDPSTSSLIRAQLKTFLTRLATQWLEPIETNLSESSLVIDMLTQGIFHGCLHAVELSNSEDSKQIASAINMYFELHVYMIYAIKGVSL
jgi:AcrR family transcriptional regulator